MDAPDKKQKQFVTHNVPGFPDGHPLELRTTYDVRMGGHTKECELFGHRKTERGIQLITIIPANPEAYEAHVRVKIAPTPEQIRGW